MTDIKTMAVVSIDVNFERGFVKVNFIEDGQLKELLFVRDKAIPDQAEVFQPQLRDGEILQ